MSTICTDAAANGRRMGRPSAEEARQKADAILISARILFSRRGYRAASMSDIADAAGVSTRTLYKYHTDKIALFAACLEIGGAEFPAIRRQAGETPDKALARFAGGLADVLSHETSFRISMLVYREGSEFPELIQAVEQFQRHWLIGPLTGFLRSEGLADDGAEEAARLFSTMALYPWQSAITFHRPLPSREAMERHAAMAAQIFVDGLKARMLRALPPQAEG